jgi:3-deoxy-D-manno-octulosonic-acid transferase
MMLVSARLSEKSLSKAFRSKILIKPALAASHKILCQTDSDRVRIKTLVPDVVLQGCRELKV